VTDNPDVGGHTSRLVEDVLFFCADNYIHSDTLIGFRRICTGTA